MTPSVKRDNFKKELKEILAKYDASITLEDFGKSYTPTIKL
jgi:hypothetical protein